MLCKMDLKVLMGINMTKILVFGATSNVGYRFIRNYSNKYDLTAVSRSHLDGLDSKVVVEKHINKEFIKAQLEELSPDFVINCIAHGNVDYCEKNKSEAKRVNYDLVVDLVDAVNLYPDAKLIHFSSNAVYGGSNAPYDEESKADPINYYGKTKNNADNYIKLNSHKYAILRPITLYGQKEEFQRNNPINWIIQELSIGNILHLVDDVFSNMLYIDDAIIALNRSVELNSEGSFNLSSYKTYSMYEIGLIVANIMMIDSSLVIGVNSSYFKGMAPRPKNTSFNNSKATESLGVDFTEIEDGIRLMLNKSK